MTKLLIVDDDIELMDMLEDYLAAENFTIIRAFNGREGADKALSDEFDAVILDVMMPIMNGFDALKQIRSQSNVPVIMLTAKGDDIDRIVGLEIGADDYISKPFNPREILARIRAVLRRTQANNQPADTEQSILRQDNLEICLSSRTVLIAGQTLDLTTAEFDLLHHLIHQSGHVVSKERLSKQVLGRELQRYDRSIDMHMSNLRKKLSAYYKDDPILTVRGQGYQWSNKGSKVV